MYRRNHHVKTDGVSPLNPKGDRRVSPETWAALNATLHGNQAVEKPAGAPPAPAVNPTVAPASAPAPAMGAAPTHTRIGPFTTRARHRLPVDDTAVPAAAPILAAPLAGLSRKGYGRYLHERYVQLVALTKPGLDGAQPHERLPGILKQALCARELRALDPNAASFVADFQAFFQRAYENHPAPKDQDARTAMRERQQLSGFVASCLVELNALRSPDQKAR